MGVFNSFSQNIHAVIVFYFQPNIINEDIKYNKHKSQV